MVTPAVKLIFACSGLLDGWLQVCDLWLQNRNKAAPSRNMLENCGITREEFEGVEERVGWVAGRKRSQDTFVESGAGGAEGMEAWAEGSGSPVQTFLLCVQHSGQIPRMTGPERSFKFPNLWTLSSGHCPPCLLWPNFNNNLKNAWTWKCPVLPTS